MKARRTVDLDGLAGIAARQRARLNGMNLRIRRRSTVHAGGPGQWILSTVIIAPICGASPSHVEIEAITGTLEVVNCETCLRMIGGGAAPASWVGGPSELVLEGTQVGLAAELFA